MKVTQNIPDGALCATFETLRNSIDKSCIFLDSGYQMQLSGGSGLTCRRHPRFELSVEHNTETGEKKIHKCPPCLKECESDNG